MVPVPIHPKYEARREYISLIMAMETILPPEDVLEAQTTQAYLFEACLKPARGKAWITILKTKDLQEAFMKAMEAARDAFEGSVFVYFSDRSAIGGSLYWTSTQPDYFAGFPVVSNKGEFPKDEPRA